MFDDGIHFNAEEYVYNNNPYVALVSQRTSGKSYSVKCNVFNDCYTRDRQFIYLRRRESECRENDVQSYVSEIPINIISDGKYSQIKVSRKRIYNLPTDDKTDSKQCIGIIMSLENSLQKKSNVYDKVDYIIFEEFITNDGVLFDEINLLKNLILTVARERLIKVILIGNTTNRMCPFFNHYSISLVNLTAGDVKEYDTPDGKIQVVFADRQKAIDKQVMVASDDKLLKNTWVTDVTNRPPKIDKRLLFTMGLECFEFKFLLRLYQYNHDNCVYETWEISKKTTPFKDKTIVVSDKQIFNRYYIYGFKKIPKYIKPYIDLLFTSSVFYSSDLTALDFRSALKILKNL